MNKGTMGELLVQLRLLEFGIQASCPLKDTGNDLIAIKGEKIKLIQVKTNGGRIKKERIFHILAHVALKYDKKGGLSLDETRIHMTDMTTGTRKPLTREWVCEIWNP
jgi:hypothetical protein